MVVCKFLGLIDVIAALIIAFMDVPIIGPVKWLIVLILLVKGVPSLFN